MDPGVTFTAGAHMYHNNTLCLYDWREQQWKHLWHLHETIVPWTAEWLLFYELFLLTTCWLGRAVHPSVDEPAPQLWAG